MNLLVVLDLLKFKAFFYGINGSHGMKLTIKAYHLGIIFLVYFQNPSWEKTTTNYYQLLTIESYGIIQSSPGRFPNLPFCT